MIVPIGGYGKGVWVYNRHLNCHLSAVINYSLSSISLKSAIISLVLITLALDFSTSYPSSRIGLKSLFQSGPIRVMTKDGTTT